MGKLLEWDFNDPVANGKIMQVNRQKSALNLKVIDLDIANGKAVFGDGATSEIRTSLDSCECRDFNLTGQYPRKNFAPCMHIYRLAMEMGLMKPTYFDKKIRDRQNIEIERQDLIKLLQDKSKDDPRGWGEWSFKIHLYNVQRKRQLAAYGFMNEIHKIDKEKRKGIIHGYEVTLRSCTCPDFNARKLPCKHIYCLALLLGIPLETTPPEYTNYKREE